MMSDNDYIESTIDTYCEICKTVQEYAERIRQSPKEKEGLNQRMVEMLEKMYNIMSHLADIINKSEYKETTND